MCYIGTFGKGICNLYFFKIEISSFDDAAKTLFVVPEQHTDEQGIPFEDKMLTQTADFKQFIKETQTCMVDGKYTQYKTDEVFDSLTEPQFEQLKAEGKVEELDSNSFSISTGFSPKKDGGKKDFKTILIIVGAAVVLIALLIFSSLSDSNKGDVPETTESTETVESTTESTETPETSETAESTTVHTDRNICVFNNIMFRSKVTSSDEHKITRHRILRKNPAFLAQLSQLPAKSHRRTNRISIHIDMWENKHRLCIKQNPCNFFHCVVCHSIFTPKDEL